MFSDKDLRQLEAKGITPAQVEAQLECFRTGFPFLPLRDSANATNGITCPADQEHYKTLWADYTANHSVTKFVPASGAASRMFKDLFAFLDGASTTPTSDFERTFFDHIDSFAFYDELNTTCQRLYNKDIHALTASGEYKDVVAALLGADGMNYGNLPKGLLSFHRMGDEVRTPAEEHMAEGVLYARRADGKVKLHFTVSHDHMALFKALVADKRAALEAAYNVDYDISFSEQKPSTDTVAATADGDVFRQPDGSMLFRPGGHGSLIENLNELDTDVVFIKNIDNVVPDTLKAATVGQKQVMGGVLVEAQQRVFEYLEQLSAGVPADSEMQAMLQFMEKTFCLVAPEASKLSGKPLADFLFAKLNRPIRVCAMVPNEGEPGGGPYIAQSPDGTYQLQILESTQLNMSDAHTAECVARATHFNPVDLVCAVRDYRGQKFDLRKYVDPATGFISKKSKDGRDLLALEHPGLWNGAMSDWNTIFLHSDISTFNPVKTVNDLLRPAHQG